VLDGASSQRRTCAQVEICCSLFAEGAPALALVGRDGEPTSCRLEPGSVLLLLARQARCGLQPSGEVTPPTVSVSVFAYSSWQRSADGLRVLGASEEVRRALAGGGGAPSGTGQIK